MSGWRSRCRWNDSSCFLSRRAALSRQINAPVCRHEGRDVSPWRFPTRALSKRSRGFGARFAAAGCSLCSPLPLRAISTPAFPTHPPYFSSLSPSFSFILPSFLHPNSVPSPLVLHHIYLPPSLPPTHLPTALCPPPLSLAPSAPPRDLMSWRRILNSFDLTGK